MQEQPCAPREALHPGAARLSRRHPRGLILLCHSGHSARARGLHGLRGTDGLCSMVQDRAQDTRSQPCLHPRGTKLSLQRHWKNEEMRSTSPKRKISFAPPISPAPFELFLPPPPETETPNKNQTPQPTRKTKTSSKTVYKRKEETPSPHC